MNKDAMRWFWTFALCVLGLIAGIGCASAPYDMECDGVVASDVDWGPLGNSCDARMCVPIQVRLGENRIRLLGFEPKILYYLEDLNRQQVLCLAVYSVGHRYLFLSCKNGRWRGGECVVYGLHGERLPSPEDVDTGQGITMIDLASDTVWVQRSFWEQATDAGVQFPPRYRPLLSDPERPVLSP